MTEEIAVVAITVTFFLTVGGVLVLRPIATRLGSLLEAMSREKMAGTRGDEAAQLREHVEHLERRLALVEERQNFSESLLGARQRSDALPPGAGS
jgi:hypothetical protein